MPKGYIKDAPGENGKAVDIPKEFLIESKRLFERNKFNQWASDKISLHRILPDARPKLCKDKVYPGDLPPTSVVIVFHNEAWSTLLRTIHSVLDRTAPDLLIEIILVDDKSVVKELHAPLDAYIAKLAKVKIIRNKKREGLIRSRLNGKSFAASKAPVVTFLDAHCEANTGWLEPLLERIYNDRSTVVCPEIDVISDENFAYQYGPSGLMRGIFNWDLHFRWRAVSTEEQKRRQSPIDPVRTPTMAGGLFAINRDYFKEIGTYDEEMDIWGGENLEISFRIWQCGGTLEIVPCSHVGHVFRKSQPYGFPKGVVDTLGKNSQRVAEVWMDGYKEFFYQRQPHLRGHAYGDISKRLEIRKKLKCKSFKWYLENIYTDAVLPNESVIAKGKVRNPASNMCLDSLSRPKLSYIGLSPCTLSAMTMIISFTVRQELVVQDICLDVSDYNPGTKVQLYECHGMKGNQLWMHEKDGPIRHGTSGMCLDRGSGGNPIIAVCDGGESQKWIFEKYYLNVTPKVKI
ncbi:uncharacterized protein TRIADDRAFT_22976 [Trichoplax adhaerens]|uniref:Polypeptide N-acetylgalactosaminyltransferase n=1 Tax=Trichoplax adhaerens TaxID=10228 RepID=B3RR08_TRIAD|nr:hypothetical protein TRIADDRAFT_22976 [Trichoplax adhaerens]EDV26796.1 hypothetical protein TRIADDRAFT_22976 [Trichoplax adhaerens]|eukprot:XP_002110792.1 hypothetical protein TRIADDRAFT_22976 [Trichoplax adhaerens]